MSVANKAKPMKQLACQPTVNHPIILFTATEFLQKRISVSHRSPKQQVTQHAVINYLSCYRVNSTKYTEWKELLNHLSLCLQALALRILKSLVSFCLPKEQEIM
ncbi:hypothetical protein XENORESO_018646 [Xenotaenia resolanae]|uniref:Uncharacterized protein n=1 Tax=Xenotaenia resolanae TaxID=208358 RepID=A0ABV0WMK0_9TELE